MPASAIVKSVTKSLYYPFNGGLDLVTPALSVDPGFALAMVNYEPWFNGGYRRVDGFERTDGHAKPSAAVFYGVVLSGTSTLVSGTVAGAGGTGATSGATGQVAECVTVSGTVYLALTNIVGTFANGEKIVQGGGTSVGTLTTTPSISYAPVGTGTSGFPYNSEMLASAQSYYRAQIGTVPGTGNALAGWQNGTSIYGWRAGTTAGTAVMYLQSGAGWTTSGITYTQTMYWGNGTSTAQSITTGGIITGVTSGATGTLYQNVVQGAAQGYVALTGVSGTFQNNESLNYSNGGTASFGTAVSTCTPFSFPVQGTKYKYRFRNENFFGGASTYNTFGVSGYGAAFQIDQSNVVMPILMPLTALANQPVGNPFEVEVYQNFLFLGFPGGMAQCSVQGVPYQFNGFLGAAQIGLGAEITGMRSMAGPALALLTQRNSQVLYGTTAAGFTLSLAAEKAGAQLYSGQLLDTVYALSNLGITSLSRTQSYGNFVGSVISQLVKPLLQAEMPNFVDATISRSANEARFYFNDGSFVIAYVPGLGQQNKAWSAIESGVTAQFGYASYSYFHGATQTIWPVLNICNTEDQNNNETAYFTSSNGDGFLYQDRSGTSFDGNPVSSYVRLAFNNLGSPAVRKYFRRADLEINSPAQILLQFAMDLSYDSTESSSAVLGLVASQIPELTVFGGGGYWDTVNWNQFLWDGQTISTCRAELNGTGQNASFLVFHQAIVDAPFVLQGLTLYFDPRRLQR